ncbi:unnamed protein product [Adineta ricciae]|uniref:Uncharacterized protein n=1 Tax=Adineta ricciae TaxID=249248 RepID=A0A815N2Q0_ADIRI|nr:unnamed protein product [Adineta ricciae]CAF1431176.1 unnamed protein product [Adineta ricciae]
MSSFDEFASPIRHNQVNASVRSSTAHTGSSSSSTHTVTESVRKNYKKLKTLVLKLKPGTRQPDLSSLDPKQLDAFVDEMITDLRDTFTTNINDLRARIKSARPDPSDPDYAEKMQLYQNLLVTMVPVIQKVQTLAEDIFNDLQALMNQLWDDICKNNARGVDRLLDDHARRTEAHIQNSFLEPFDVLEAKLNQIKQMYYSSH